VPNSSESSGKIPNHSETFRSVPQNAEPFRSVPHHAERKDNHTITVREAARLFEAAGVARTERSIVNWCQPNKMGIARLDCYFDPNERKYYLTPESVERAIEEEKSRAAKLNDTSQGAEGVPKHSERGTSRAPEDAQEDEERVRELEKQVLDLKITNRGKDYLIDQLKSERDGFFGQLLDSSRKVGELETKLFQLNPPA
jgi:hypothetical protein